MAGACTMRVVMSTIVASRDATSRNARATTKAPLTLISKPDHQSCRREEEIGAGVGIWVALWTRMSTVPTVENAAVMVSWSVTSATKVRILAEGWAVSRVVLASPRVDSVRPDMATVDAPAAAKARAVARPMPALPPVMKTVLLATEREGLVGSMAG